MTPPDVAPAPLSRYEARRLAVPDARVPSRTGRAVYAVLAAGVGLLLRAVAVVSAST
jgi:hypothetical protein